MDKSTILQMVKEMKQSQKRVEYLMDSILEALESVTSSSLSREDIKEIMEELHDRNNVPDKAG